VDWNKLRMARREKFRWGATGVAALFVVAALVLWIAPSRQTSSAQDGIRPIGPLISRGYTDAPAGTAVIAGDPASGGVIQELRVVDGQKVKKDEVVAVLSNYSKADVTVRTTEAELQKAKRQREAMVNGYRVAEIAMQEVVVKSAAEELKLKTLEMTRSGKPPDQKQLEQNISQQSLEREQAKLRVMKETLATDLAQIDIDITITSAKLDQARISREQALVRSPLDGVVVQIYSRQGERVSASGIVKIVDMGQLRVLADVDELHLGRVVTGGKVEVTFRGSTTAYRGTISRIAPTVKRMQRIEPDGGSSTDARVVQVEIKLDDPSGMPQVLGRETRVTFLYWLSPFPQPHRRNRGGGGRGFRWPACAPRRRRRRRCRSAPSSCAGSAPARCCRWPA
jgi:multidrug resistance efflux pump